MTQVPSSAGMTFRAVQFPPGRPLVVAVLPVTPSSAIKPDVSGLMATVERAVVEGADLVEFCWAQQPHAGGQENGALLSTLVTATCAHHPEVAVAVTTAEQDVAREVCAAGAHLLRGVPGRDSTAVLEVAAEHGAGFVVVRSDSADLASPDDDAVAVVDAIARDLTLNAKFAVTLGVPTDGVLVDPGLDTINEPDTARTVLGNMDRLAGIGWPIVASLSVGDLLDGVLDAQGLDDRASLVTPTVLALLNGATVFRTRDVATTRRALEDGAFWAG